MPETTEPVRRTRGFASMDPARQREIASKGGSSVPPTSGRFRKITSSPPRRAEKGVSTRTPDAMAGAVLTAPRLPKRKSSLE